MELPRLEQSELLRRAHHHHFFFLSILLISRPLYHPAFDNKTPFKLTTQDDSFPPSPPLSFIFPFFYSSHLASRTILPIQKPLPRGSRTLISLSLFSFSFMRLHLLFIPYHWHPRGRLGRHYYTKPRLADMYIRPSSGSSRRTGYVDQSVSSIGIILDQMISPLFSSLSPACLLDSAIVRWNRCPHDLGRLPPSRSSLSPSLSWFIRQSWTTFTLTAPIYSWKTTRKHMCFRSVLPMLFPDEWTASAPPFCFRAA